jgi:hypothetical protein
MQKLPALLLIFSLLFLNPLMKVNSVINPENPESSRDEISEAELLYGRLGEPGLPLIALKSALHVYHKFSREGLISNLDAITIVDFDQPSNRERLFVIDLTAEKMLYKTLVAHGKNSGEILATNFSNNLESHQSSPGFYITGSSYLGRHGYSLALEGIEKGINDNAKERSIVMHGATYVSYDYIRTTGRLGRSFGCPAVPEGMAHEIIDAIKNRSLFFIYSSGGAYIKNSNLFSASISNP